MLSRQHSYMEVLAKVQVFDRSSHTFLKLHSQGLEGKKLQQAAQCVSCVGGWIELPSTFPWPMLKVFDASPPSCTCSNPYRYQPGPGSRARDSVQSWLTKHPHFCSILKKIHDEHVYSNICSSCRFQGACWQGQDSTQLWITTGHPTSHGAKLFVAATGLRAYRKKASGYAYSRQ